MKRELLYNLFTALFVLSLMGACQTEKEVRDVEVFHLEGDLDTTVFQQAPFEWRITPRFDYSKVFVTKLFLCQAEYDKDYLGAYKTCDNGKQTVYMTCEQALEAIKGMDAITLGLPKIVYLVGWQYNGHDSKYPALFEGNKAIKRDCDEDALQSIRWLMEEAKKYHTVVSLHINLYDAYTDSPLFDQYVKADVLARDKDGKLIHGDWGYKVSYAAEWEKGLVQVRLDSLCKLLPIQEAGTIHIDAFHNNVPRPYLVDGKPVIKFESPISPWHGYTNEQEIEAKKNIIKYLDSKGIDVTTEGIWNMSMDDIKEGYFPMYWHFNSLQHIMSLKASQACGGNSYGAVCAFGNNVNAEQLFRSTPNLADAFEVFKKEFCKTTLICQYLNTFGREMLVADKNGNGIGVMDDGLRTMYRDGKTYVAKDGEMLAEEGDIFIPAKWLGDHAIVAYSEQGCEERTWTIPAGTKLGRKTKAWLISDKGRSEFRNFSKSRNSITLSLEPGEMVLFTD